MPLLTMRQRYPVTAPQRASMVATINTTLIDRCTIRRTTSQASDTEGGEDDVWGDAYTNVPCRLRSIVVQGAEQVLGERLSGELAWTVVLPDGQDVTVRDQIVITSQTPNRTFQVTAIPGTDTLSVATEVAVVELEA